MKIQQLILLIGVMVCLPVMTAAQQPDASKALAAVANGESANQKVQLSDGLRKIEKMYGVNILYKSKEIEGIYIQMTNKKMRSVNLHLNHLLKPIGFLFKKLAPNSYVVYSKKDQAMVSGIVIDATTGDPLAGVNILLKGSTKGTTTSSNGHYQLVVPSLQDTLIFSYLGFKSKVVPIRGRTEIDVQLQPKTIMGEELVVTGFSKIKKKHIASSVSIMNMDRIEEMQVTKMEQLFSGMIPGVVMRQTANRPGAVPGQIIIRGRSTLQNADPLVIVDGIEQSLTDLDPSNIKSITVLKDAASAALYGARGANGVIVITTKRGQRGGPVRIDLSSSVSFQTPANLIDFVEAAEYMRLRNEALTLQGLPQRYTKQQINAAERGESVNIDWLDKIMRRQAYTFDTQVDISGGGDMGTFRLMLGRSAAMGTIPHQGQVRYTARFNTNLSLGDKFVLKADFYARRLKVNDIYMASGSGIFYNAWRMAPVDSIYYKPGTQNQHYMLHNGANPVAFITDGGTQHSMYDRVTINLRPTYNINENFRVEGNLSYMINKSASKHVRKTFKLYNGNGKPTEIWENSVGASQDVSISQITARGLLHYTTDLRRGEDQLKVTLGSDIMNHTYTNYLEYNRVSFFGKVNYALMDSRYIFVLTARADGSSKFAPGHRWGYFPAGAFAWNVTNESFMDAIVESGFLTQLKFRFSFGYLGNNEVEPYLWQPIVNNWGWTMRVPNPEFTWEKQWQADIGIDLSAFSNRLHISADVYKKHSYDLIFSSYPVPPLTGSYSLESAVNIGVVENKGWEFSIQWQDNIGNFSYNIGGMVFNNINSVLKAGNTMSDSLVFKDTSDKIWYRGIPMQNYYGFETNGYFQSEQEIENAEAVLPNTVVGDIRYVDQNGDGVINFDDRTYLGTPVPHYNYAVHLNMNYKRWGFAIYGQGVGKRLGRLGGLVGYPVIMDGGTNSYGKPREYYKKNRWTPENRHSRFPRVWVGASPNDKLSDVWLSDASYFKISSIRASYTIPAIGTNLSDVKFYINVQNPFTFSNYEGVDPEKNGSNGRYPRMTSFIFGIELTIQ